MSKQYPVSVSCEVREASPSGYFNWLRRKQDAHGRRGPAGRHSDEALLAHLRAIHAEVKGEYCWSCMHKGWLNLAAVIELLSRQVVGWSLQPPMQASLVKDALASSAHGLVASPANA